MSGIRISQWTATAGIKEGTEELVRSGALPLEWGEALETRLFPERYGRLASAGDVPGLPGWGGACRAVDYEGSGHGNGTGGEG